MSESGLIIRVLDPRLDYEEEYFYKPIIVRIGSEKDDSNE